MEIPVVYLLLGDIVFTLILISWVLDIILREEVIDDPLLLLNRIILGLVLNLVRLIGVPHPGKGLYLRLHKLDGLDDLFLLLVGKLTILLVNVIFPLLKILEILLETIEDSANLVFNLFQQVGYNL